MAAETGFMIDGVLYEVPSLDSLTMDEAQVLYDYSGLSLEDFVPVEDNQEEAEAELDQKMRNPGFMGALMHIAYQRDNPRLTPARVKQAIGQANIISALERLAGQEEAEADPPASTTEPEPVSPPSSVGSSESSGNGSGTGSDGQAVQLEPTTTIESATSSISPPTSSVA